MINKAILMGRLTKDPELRHTNSGTAVCSFSIAIDNGYGENRTTDFINIVAWKGTAEFVAKNFEKGRMIIVVGRISTRSWDGTDGKKNYATEVIANEVAFGETKKQAENNNSDYRNEQSTVSQNTNDFVPIGNDDDLPF